MITSLGKAIIKYPLLKFLHTINFDYSDMNGFGSYENAFMQRIILRICGNRFIAIVFHSSK